jgi:hypothetical protein
MAISPDPVTGLEEFFTSIWGTDNCFVYVPTKQQDTLEWKKRFYKWPASKDAMFSNILKAAATGKDVYFSPVMWATPILEASSIKGTNVLWAEFDGIVPETWFREDTTETVPGRPSIVIQSSTEGHAHCYWKLTKPCADLDFITSSNRAIAYTYGADYSGWDVEQVLRPPFTTNFKHNLPVLVAAFDNILYEAKRFTGFKPVKELVLEGIDENDLPSYATILAEYSWDPDTLDLLTKQLLGRDRSGALMRLAYRSAELGLTDAEMYSILIYLDDRVGKFVGRNDRKKRIRDLINKAKQKYPHSILNPDFSGLISKAIPVLEETEQTFYGFGDFINKEFPASWLIDGLVMKNTIGILTGPPNTGKTQIMINMALSSALGKSFADFEPVRPLKTLFLSLEMGPVALSHIMQNMAQRFSEEELVTLQGMFIVAPIDEAIPLHTAPGMAFIENCLSVYKPDILAIDSLSLIVKGKISEDQAILDTFKILKFIKNRYDLGSIFITHHTRKAQGDNKKPNKIDDLYGSQYIAASVDYAISAFPRNEEGTEIDFAVLKNRMAPYKKTIVLSRTEHIGFEVVDGHVLGEQFADNVKNGMAKGVIQTDINAKLRL